MSVFRTQPPWEERIGGLVYLHFTPMVQCDMTCFSFIEETEKQYSQRNDILHD